MDEHPKIAQALAAVMADVQAVGKDSRNTQQNFNFRGIDAVVNAVGPALRKHGVLTMPTVLESHYDTIPTKSGGTMRQCTMKVQWRFHGPAGDHLDAVVLAEAMDSGDKATSKAHSVSYRTALLQVLCIPTDDPDPDATSYERAPAQPPVQLVTADQAEALRSRINGAEDAPGVRKAFAAKFGVRKATDLPACRLAEAEDWLSDLEPGAES